MVTESNRHTAYGASTAAAAEMDAGLRKYMLGVYNYMASGLLLSGIVALLVASSPGLLSTLYVIEGGRVVGTSGLGLIAQLSPLGLLLVMSFRAHKMGVTALQTMYWAFVALMGVGLTSWLLMYTGTSVARVFFITAAAFGGLSLYGYTTNRNLSGMGTFLFMGVIGLVIAGIVNIFLGSSMLMFIMSVAGVGIFAALTAYDTQRIKNTYYEGMGYEEYAKSSIFGAVGLYLNFINMMQFLLMLFGNRE